MGNRPSRKTSKSRRRRLSRWVEAVIVGIFPVWAYKRKMCRQALARAQKPRRVSGRRVCDYSTSWVMRPHAKNHDPKGTWATAQNTRHERSHRRAR